MVHTRSRGTVLAPRWVQGSYGDAQAPPTEEKGCAMTIFTNSRVRVVLLVVAAAVLLSACAAGPNPEVGTAVTETGEPAGFWLGVWHGFITPVTFVISLFTDDVNFYEVHNSGNWYDFGWIIGFSILPGGGASRRRR